MTSTNLAHRAFQVSFLIGVILTAGCRSVYFEHPMPDVAEAIEVLPEFWGHTYEVLPVKEDDKAEMARAPIYEKGYLMEFRKTTESKGVVYFHNYLPHDKLKATHEGVDIALQDGQISFTTPDTVMTYDVQRVPTGYTYKKEVFYSADLVEGKLYDEDNDPEMLVLKKRDRIFYINRRVTEHWELDLFEVLENGDILWHEVDEEYFKEHIETWRSRFPVTDLEDKKFLVAPSDAQLDALIGEGKFFIPSLLLKRMQIQ